MLAAASWTSPTTFALRASRGVLAELSIEAEMSENAAGIYIFGGIHFGGGGYCLAGWLALLFAAHAPEAPAFAKAGCAENPRKSFEE